MRDPAAWNLLATDWNRLSASDSPLADATWACCFAGAFYPPGPTPVEVHAVYEDGRLSAVIPLERKPRIPRVFESLDSEHSPYWLFPTAKPSSGLARAIIDHLLSRADYMFFRRLHLEGPMCRLLVEAAREAGLRTSLIQSPDGDSTLSLQRPWDAFRASLSKKLMKDMPRHLRNLSKLGPVRVEMVSEASPALEAALVECLALEEKGWKGVSGSPIRAHPNTYNFYTRLAREMSARGRFTLCLLRLGERIIAFEYWLRGGGHIELLKISFDPEFGKLSPGNVLRYAALQREIETGDATMYHLGRPSEWKARWTQVVQPLCSLRVYAPTLGGSLAFFTGPVLRSRLKRYSPLHRAWLAIERRLSGE